MIVIHLIIVHWQEFLDKYQDPREADVAFQIMQVILGRLSHDYA